MYQMEYATLALISGKVTFCVEKKDSQGQILN